MLLLVYILLFSQGLQPIVSATVKRLRYDHALFDLNPSSSDESSSTTNIQESQLQEVRREIDSIADFPAVNDSRLFMSNFQDRSQNFLPKSSSSTETRNLHQVNGMSHLSKIYISVFPLIKAAFYMNVRGHIHTKPHKHTHAHTHTCTCLAPPFIP